MPHPQAQRSLLALLPLLLLVLLTLTGCATTNNNTNNNNTNTTHNTTTIAFKSPAIHNRTLPATYTCDGKNTNPPLEWGTIPADTSELLLTAIALNPTTPNATTYTPTIEWALSGINPNQHKLNPGEHPPGTHPGLTPHNKRNYNICPKPHTTTKYQFMLYAIPANIKISPNFAAQPILTALTKPNSQTTPTAEGAFITNYTRK
jgi:phosphatidylethanolamine-binding protein (PEBP) family uncharacterized protein